MSVDIHVDLLAEDDCDQDPRVTLESILCNEPLGPEDIQAADFGTGDYDFKLRAARYSKGTGRAYLITYLVRDQCGNEFRGSDEVLVPYDLRDRKRN